MADIDYLSKKGLNRYDNKVKNYIGIELTKAEYDQLSEEEKNKGTYWITDYSSSGNNPINALTSDDIVDNLESTATNLPLSANQGRILNEQMLHIVSFDATTGELVTKSWDYVG